MNPKHFLYLGLLIVALMVAACSPKTTPTALPPTDTPEPTIGFTEEGAPYRGNPNAPVTMLEYSEFQ